jgi:hypothetical protein
VLTERPGVALAVNQVRRGPTRFDVAEFDGNRRRGGVAGYSGLKGGVMMHPNVVEITDRLYRT